MNLKIQDERGYNQLFTATGSALLRSQRRHEWFAAQIQTRHARRILEIGCGTGDAAAVVARITGAAVVGVDISDMFLNQARLEHKAENLQFRKFDLFSDDLMELGKFDFIYGNGILHHLIPRLTQTLEILRRITSDRGGMAFIEPNMANPYCAFIFGTRMGRRLARLEPDEMAFYRRSIQRIVGEAGWKNVSVVTRDFLVPGLPQWCVRPALALEPLLEATRVTSWLAQSHFIVADKS